MTKETTIRAHIEPLARRGHNRRDGQVVSHEPHIDPRGHHETWIDRDALTVCEEALGDAVRAYASTHPRCGYSDVRGYIEHVRNSKRGRRNKQVAREKSTYPVYELIIGIGSSRSAKDDAGRSVVDDAGEVVRPWALPEDICYDILLAYASDLVRRCPPSIEIVGIYYHADEQGRDGVPGAPHLHIDFVPVASGYKRGPEKQISISKALSQAGYNAEGMSKTQTVAFAEAERMRLWDIAQPRLPGYELARPDKDRYRPSLATATFKLKEAEADARGLSYRKKQLEATTHERVPPPPPTATDERDAYLVREAVRIARRRLDEEEEERALADLLDAARTTRPQAPARRVPYVPPEQSASIV